MSTIADPFDLGDVARGVDRLADAVVRVAGFLVTIIGEPFVHVLVRQVRVVLPAA